MKILFVGVSSFTGYHFVKKLSENKKYKITCTLTKNFNSYNSIKFERLKLIKNNKNINLINKTKFGDKKFIQLLIKNKFDIICLHHALTKNYNSNLKFNLKKSLIENTRNIETVFKIIDRKTIVIVSNTVFQKIKSKNYESVNNYGISKSISYDKIKYFCKKYKLKYKSIFITNPWGTLEEKKLNFYLIKKWIENKNPIISHPNYIRDNIYIDKLSKLYKKIVLSKSNKIEYFPSGICSTNKVFIEAFKKKFEQFFNKKVKVTYSNKASYDQPICRINGNKISRKVKIKQNLNKYFLYYQRKLTN